MSRSLQMQRWIREYMRYLPIKRQFYFYGNIYDKVPYPITNPDKEEVRYAYLELRELFPKLLDRQGYEMIGFYDIVDGLVILPQSMQATFDSLASGKDAKPTAGQPQESVKSPASSQSKAASKKFPLQKPADAIKAIRTVIANKDIPCAFILDFASRLIADPNQLYHEQERQLFLMLLKCSQEAGRVFIPGENRMVFNHICLVCDKLNDIPSWMYLNNPFTKSIQIDLPNDAQRGIFFDQNKASFPEWQSIKNDTDKIRQTFVDLTQGMKIYELESLCILSQRESIPLSQIKDTIERYKYGITESLWDLVDSKKLQGAEAFLRKRVKGQDGAIERVLDIVKRAKMGLSGIQHSARSNKPRGVLFFAGPTGVGKTELAKAMAELLFGDDNACVRFDMSEYGQEQADQRLLGAPPGYVGYEEGGQLTNKLKENPFCVLLFDEIDKAHPSIFDKFLQILEDGRMTDGKGETVYFSESIIIFTSNIGTTVEDRLGNRSANIDSQMPPEKVRERILKAIEEHFKYKLGRPELFNRFGNNFVVFDFIQPEVMDQIVDKILDSISQQISETRGWQLEFTSSARTNLYKRARANIEMGGRGAGNVIEEVIVNPLGRYLFEHPPSHGATLVVTAIEETKQPGILCFNLKVETK